MDNKTVFVITPKGEDEVHSKTTHLAGDVKRTLLMIDGKATFGEISKRVAPSLRANLNGTFSELEKGGFIRDKARSQNIPKMVIPSKMSPTIKMATPTKDRSVDEDAGDLDFMSGFTTPAPQPQATAVNSANAEAKAELKAEAETLARSKQAFEAEKLKAQQEAKAILLKAEQEAAKLREEAELRAKTELDATRLKAEQEAKGLRDELEASKLKAEQEAKLHLEAATKVRQQAEAARIKAVQEAEKLKAEQEAAKLQAEREAEKLKSEREAARLQVEQEAAKLKAQLEAEKLKSEQQAARLKAEMEAAKLKAEQEAEKLRAEQEAVKLKAEQEAAKLKAEQEAARLKSEQEAAKLKAEMEAAKLKAEQEAEKLRAEQEAAKLKADQEEKLKAEQEAAEMRAELEAAKIRAELEAKARLDAETKAHARMKAEEEAERVRAKQETERIAKEREAAMARAEAEKLAQQQDDHATVTVPENKPVTFAFDTFQVDEPQPQVLSDKNSQSAERAVPPKTASSEKSGTFSFDSFLDAPQPPVNATRAEPSSEIHTLAEQSIAPPVDSQSIGVQPDHGQPEQSHVAAEDLKASEAQTKKLADEQAKVWAEAEQRALETAKTHAEKSLHQTEHPATEVPVIRHAPRTKREPFPWGKLTGVIFKLSIFLLVLLVGALFAVPYVIPMRDYMPKVEQFMSEKMKQPVHIGYLSGRILPTPRLELGEIYIGEVKQFQAAKAQLNFSVAGLFDEKRKPIDSVVMEGVKVNGKGLQNVSVWLQKLMANDQYPVSRLTINRSTLDADSFELTGIEGEFNFNSAGKFTQGTMRGNSGKYTLDMNVTPENKLQISLSVRGSALPLLPNWMFDDLNAKGELNDNELLIGEFDARILGGTLRGNAKLDWNSGWQAQGSLTAKALSMKQLSNLLDGDAEGSARFKMASPDLTRLTDSAVLDGSFIAKKGTFNGMDIVETARLRSKEHLPGGRTHFDEFTGIISFADNTYHFKQMKITTDVLNASAALNIEKRQLTGSINARLSIQQGMAPVDLQIGGAIDNPRLRVAR